MEAVQNAANAASKMIWGEGKTESGQEPASGSQGQGTKSEPFDQGNKRAGAEGETTSSSTAAGDAGPSDPTTGSGVTESQTPVQKQQGADKPMDEPKDEGAELLKKRDPNDHSGEPLKMHDGSEKKEEESKDEGGNSLEKKSKEEGTGEKYVKSSGLAADGGDFDATNPGAGAEANRLLEQKGVHKDEKGRQQVDDEAAAAVGGSAEDSKTKPKTMDKIKEKLHIGKH